MSVALFAAPAALSIVAAVETLNLSVYGPCEETGKGRDEMGRKTPTVSERTSRRAAPRKAAKPRAKTAKKPLPASSVDASPVAPDAPAPTVETALGKRELIARVVTASGIRKKHAKPVVETMLKELGDALARGETLNLQPFGKANVKRHKELANADVIEVRLRRSKLAVQAAEEAAAEPVAEPRAPRAGALGNDPLAEPGKEG